MHNPEPPSDRVANRAPADSSPASAWVRRHYARITASVGGLFLFLAALTPVIAPAEQRGTVAIITVLFGFTGAFLLYSMVSSNKAQALGEAKQVRDEISARAKVPVRVARPTRLWAVIGLSFGLLLVLAGLAAPFALSAGDTNADARFLMVLGFAPVALSGGLIGFAFWRNLRARAPIADSLGEPYVEPSGNSADSMAASFARIAVASGGLLVLCAVILVVLATQSAIADIAATTAGIGATGLVLMLAGFVMSRRSRTTPARVTHTNRRAPVTRVPGNTLYRRVMPIAIAMLLILIVMVISVVLVATLTPLLQWN